MIRTLKGRGLVLLAAAPLLGGVATAPGAHADGSVPAVRTGSQDAAAKPPPRPKAHGEHKAEKHKKHKKHCHGHGKKNKAHGKHGKQKSHGKKHSHHSVKATAHKTHGKKHEAHGTVVLHTDGPERTVFPGRTYEWSFEVLAKGPQKARRAVFLATLPRSLVFVSGDRCKATGRTVLCHLGTLKTGRWAEGEIKARVSERATAGQKISLRGTVMWGAVVDTGRFPAVRVAKSSGHAHARPSGHAHVKPSGHVHAKTPPERARVAGRPHGITGAG